MGWAAVPRLAGGRAGTGRRPVRRRARSPLSWQPDRAAQTLCPPQTQPLSGDIAFGQRGLAAMIEANVPERYVSRQRLCLRGTTDYWVNDALGQPFFAVERPIDHGLLEALRSDIVPRLLKDVPGQPTAAELKADRYRARFVILFDREGYSPEFFKEMWQTHRIACITYHK